MLVVATNIINAIITISRKYIIITLYFLLIYFDILFTKGSLIKLIAIAKNIGNKLIEKELQNIPNPKVKEKATEYIANIKSGQRDFRF